MNLQERAPLYETLLAYVERGIVPMHTPGHKGGHFVPPELRELMGERALALDLPAMEATDTPVHPTHCIREAQELAALLHGAGRTFFLVGGASMGIGAMVMAAVGPGQSLVLPRNVHKSVISALVLSGARPHFIMPEMHPSGGALGLTAEAVEAALEKDPNVAAVLLTRPTYYGLARDLEAVAEVAHKHGVPLLVDEAHGAHLPFLPEPSPRPAIACGADAAVQSWHKTLSALAGTAQLHVAEGGRLSGERVHTMLNQLQSTSPNYLMLASLDLTRRWLALEGEAIFAQAAHKAQALASAVDRVPGLSVLGRGEGDAAALAGHRQDPLRLVVDVTGLGISGFTAQLFLREQHGIEDEMGDDRTIVLLVQPLEPADWHRKLLMALRDMSQRASDLPQSEPMAHVAMELPPQAMTPREATFAVKKTVPLAEAAGAVCGETVTFYPPGIPLLVPGETITPEVLDTCRRLLAGGAHPYASDASLETLVAVDMPAESPKAAKPARRTVRA